MENEVWSEISAFLNNLRCGDVSRKSYLHFPELEEADKIRKVKKANFETEMRKLNAEQRQQIENYLSVRGRSGGRYGRMPRASALSGGGPGGILRRTRVVRSRRR